MLNTTTIIFYILTTRIRYSPSASYTHGNKKRHQLLHYLQANTEANALSKGYYPQANAVSTEQHTIYLLLAYDPLNGYCVKHSIQSTGHMAWVTKARRTKLSRPDGPLAFFLVFHKTWRQTSTNWILLQRDDKWGLDKWKEAAHYSSPFKSRTHFQLCLFYRLWASLQIPCEFKCNFYVKPSKPNLNSKWWISKSVLHNNGQFTVTNSQLSSQGSNTEYPIWTTYTDWK